MSKTDSYDALLTVCIQDLHAGETMLADTMPELTKAVNDPALAAVFERVRSGAERAAERLAETDRHQGGAKNLWMDGITSDARRDTRSVEAGPLLDAALIGAVRKAKAAQIVSYDTAIAVARALKKKDFADTLVSIRRAAQTLNRALALRLP